MAHELSSSPCRFCRGRFLIWGNLSRDQARDDHEKRCELSIDCPHCSANIGTRCTTKSGKPSATHTGRLWIAA